jgi:hypothetical protein
MRADGPASMRAAGFSRCAGSRAKVSFAKVWSFAILAARNAACC